MSVSKSEEGILPYASSSNPAHPGEDHRPNSYRAEAVVFAGEFVGTFMFLFLSFAGTQIAAESATVQDLLPASDSTLPEVSKLLYISFSFGIALAVNVAVFADISGGMFNPAVTTGLWLIGLVRWNRAVHTIFAQLIASIAAAAVVDAILPGPLPVATTLAPSMSISRGLFLEMFMTAQLVLVILAVPASAAKAIYIGLTLFVAEICSVYYTGGSLNPARSFGPAVITGFVGYHWIYWLGPIMGAGLATGTYMLAKVGQGEHARQKPDHA